jgi:hypothetical protein
LIAASLRAHEQVRTGRRDDIARTMRAVGPGLNP